MLQRKEQSKELAVTCYMFNSKGLHGFFECSICCDATYKLFFIILAHVCSTVISYDLFTISVVFHFCTWTEMALPSFLGNCNLAM